MVPLALLVWPITWVQRVIDRVAALGLRLPRLPRLTFPRAVFIMMLAAIVVGRASEAHMVSKVHQATGDHQDSMHPVLRACGARVGGRLFGGKTSCTLAET